MTSIAGNRRCNHLEKPKQLYFKLYTVVLAKNAWTTPVQHNTMKQIIPVQLLMAERPLCSFTLDLLCEIFENTHTPEATNQIEATTEVMISSSLRVHLSVEMSGRSSKEFATVAARPRTRIAWIWHEFAILQRITSTREMEDRYNGITV